MHGADTTDEAAKAICGSDIREERELQKPLELVTAPSSLFKPLL